MCKHTVCHKCDGPKMITMKSNGFISLSHSGSTQQFVVQANHERAEFTDVHEVAAEDVDSAHLAPGPLLARPAEQHRESPHRHLLHVLEGMEEDVRSVFRQVQTADVKTSWENQHTRIRKRDLNQLNVAAPTPAHLVFLCTSGPPGRRSPAEGLGCQRTWRQSAPVRWVPSLREVF